MAPGASGAAGILRTLAASEVSGPGAESGAWDKQATQPDWFLRGDFSVRAFRNVAFEVRLADIYSDFSFVAHG